MLVNPYNLILPIFFEVTDPFFFIKFFYGFNAYYFQIVIYKLNIFPGRTYVFLFLIFYIGIRIYIDILLPCQNTII